MFALRSASRALPRTSRSLSTQCIRRNAQPYTSISSTWRQVTRKPAAAFSTYRSLKQTEGEVNGELAAKLESEISLEKDMRDPDSFPAHLKEYLDNSPYTLEDTAGKEEVVMTRKFGDEQIRITFSIDDINHMDEDADAMGDQSLMDEMDDPADMPTDTQSGGANTKGAINRGRTSDGNFRVAPEDKIAPADREELSDEDDVEEPEPSFQAHLNISVDRPGKGVLEIDAIAQDGLMVIENVNFFKDKKLLEPGNTEVANTYTGPPFGNLDEDLQVLFEKYLDERGINTTMALFVPEYIDFKEQKEYMGWLSSIKNFVE